MKNIINNYSSIEQLTNQYLNKQKSTEKKINGISFEEILKQQTQLKAQDTGLNYGRTVILDCETGDYIIKAVGKEQKVI